MGGLRTGIWRRIAGAAGLAGLVFYVSLIPAQSVSQVVHALVRAELTRAVICDAGLAPTQKAPATGGHNGQFYHNSNGFQLAALTSGVTFAIPPEAVQIFLRPKNEFALRRAALTPQSRGPPHLV